MKGKKEKQTEGEKNKNREEEGAFNTLLLPPSVPSWTAEESTSVETEAEEKMYGQGQIVPCSWSR